MQVSYIEIDSIRIAYLEINPDANQTIFFIHGNSISKSCWRKQFESDAIKNFRLIAFDLPGHGESGQAENLKKIYSLKGFASVAVKFIAALSAKKPYVLAGLSLGTNVIAEMFAYDLQPAGILLSGPCIAGKNFNVADFILPGTKVNVVFTEDVDEADVLQYANETLAIKNEENIQSFINDYKKTDKKVRSSLAKSISAEDYSDEVELVRRKNIPTLIVFGKDEKIINSDYLDNADLPLWKGEIFKIYGASHFVQIDQPEAFNELLYAFAQDVFK